MSSKKKIIVSISSFAILIMAVVIAVVAVLAAQSITVKSSVNVTYTAKEVAAKVTSKYKIGDTGTLTNIGSGSISFDGTEDLTNNTQTTGTITSSTDLTSTNNYIEFVFTFTNEGDAEYTATLTLPATVDNFEATYTVPNTAGATKVTDTSFRLKGKTTTAVEYKVKFKIKDVSKNAELKGDFQWVME